MENYDEDLIRFEAEGAAPLPDTPEQGYVEHNGGPHLVCRLWVRTTCVPSPRRTRPQRQLGGIRFLPHGNGYRAIVIDSRGHGRSTRDEQPYTYELMASDVVAVMDTLGLEQARLVGWSDGACTGLILAANSPARVAGVFPSPAIWIRAAPGNS